MTDQPTLQESRIAPPGRREVADNDGPNAAVALLGHLAHSQLPGMVLLRRLMPAKLIGLYTS